MNANVGTLDRAARLLLGLGLIAAAALGWIGWWGFLGVIPMATAVIRFCPAYRLFGVNTCRTGGGVS
ncbi:MAG: DUF2892 domain-containing protein [Nevskia sp.]|nr:DUF2892 domain-containing protein [Nevskia sp.]